MHMPIFRSIGSIILLFLTINGVSQSNHPITRDTLRLDLFHADKIFIDSNLQLLAQRYNIDVQRALILQARLWPNPNLSVAQGPIVPIYDPNSQYPHSNFFYKNELSAGVSQLILLAGKRNKQIKLAEARSEERV